MIVGALHPRGYEGYRGYHDVTMRRVQTLPQEQDVEIGNTLLSTCRRGAGRARGIVSVDGGVLSRERRKGGVGVGVGGVGDVGGSGGGGVGGGGGSGGGVGGFVVIMVVVAARTGGESRQFRPHVYLCTVSALCA